jgi:hypothetical protein
MEGAQEVRFTARGKAEAVLRLLKGEEPSAVAGEAGVPVDELFRWKDIFVRSGDRALEADACNDATREAAERSPAVMAPVFTLDAVPTMVPFGFELVTAKLDDLVKQWKREAED